MEIKKVTKDLTKNYLTGVQVYRQNSQGEKVRDLDSDSSLIEVLRYCLVLSGIRKNNLPDESQTSVLINFIKTQLGRFTIQEIKSAFELAVSGKLSVQGEPYQNFSCGFFAGVMKAYDEYIRRVGFKRENEDYENKYIAPVNEDQTMSEFSKLIEDSIKEEKNLLKTNGKLGFSTYYNASAIAYRLKVCNEYKKKIKPLKREIFKDACQLVKSESIDQVKTLEFGEFSEFMSGSEVFDIKNNKYYKLSVTRAESKGFEMWLDWKIKNKYEGK